MLVKLISSSVIAGALLVGCGGETNVQNQEVANMPHQIDMKPKHIRGSDLTPEGEEYLNFMKTYNLNSRIFYITLSYTRFNDFYNQNPKLHYVFYYDSDHNKQTGYYDPWVPNSGADYLFEDNTLYRYTGTPGSHEWSWEAIYTHRDDPNDFFHNNYIKGALVYGVSLNQDWTQENFLGYYDSATDYLERSFNFTEDTDRYFRTSQDNDTFYLHSYKKKGQKLDPTEKYYNYTFTVNMTTYHTQGSILFNEAWEVLADNLMYEVREYDTITVVPKKYLTDGDIKIKAVEIRDTDWNQLHLVSDGENISKVTSKEQLQDMIKIGEDVRSIDTSAITDMSSLFSGVNLFNQNIGAWDVSNVINMHAMFSGARLFNQDIGAWDVSNVTDMHAMFAFGTFNQDIGAWNVSNVTNMRDMFSRNRFNQDIGAWDVSNVTDMGFMFISNYLFNQNLSAWDVSNVTAFDNFSNNAHLFEDQNKPHFIE